jgi:hypothetical protein
MYLKIPNMSIYGFSSFSIIGIYLIYLFISGNLKDLTFPTINDKIILSGVLAVVFVGLWAAYFFGYGNIKKNSKAPTRKERLRINRENKRKRNTASTIFSFSLLGALLLVALFAVYINKDNS